MNTAISANNRWGNSREEKRMAQASGDYQPVTGVTRNYLCNPTGETDEQRKQRIANQTSTRKSMWR